MTAASYVRRRNAGPPLRRITWLRVIKDPDRTVRLRHLRRWALSGIEGVETIVISETPVDAVVGPNTKILVSARRRSQAHRRPRRFRLLRRALDILATVDLTVFRHLMFGKRGLIVTKALGSAPTVLTFFVGHLLRRRPYAVIAEHWYSRESRVTMLWYRTVVRHAKVVVAQSSKSSKFMVETLGVGQDRVLTAVGTLGDLEELPYNQALADELRSWRGIQVVCVGRFIEVKGQAILIRAFQHVATENARLHLVGGCDDAYGRWCQELCQGDPRIVFHGRRSFADVLAFYRGCNLFALANQFAYGSVEAAESFGWAPLEAGYMGLPLLLTTATGCADDVVVPGITGYQVDHRRHDLFRNRLAWLLADEARLKEMGKAAERHCRALCSETSVAELQDHLLGIFGGS